MQPIVIHTADVSQTVELGVRLGRHAEPGTVLALSGDLGSGKTQLAKGLARGLGVEDERVVNSPTYVLVNEYAGRLAIYHLDAYRLQRAGELEALGFSEMCAAGGVIILEWAERVSAALPEDRIDVRLRPTSEHGREVSLHARGPQGQRVLQNAALGHNHESSSEPETN